MNISPLLSTAAGIRDEKARYANTATRVGTLLYNMCLAMADTDATASDGRHMAQNLGQWLTTHDNLTTLDALNAALDAMNVDTPQGLHCFKCFGIPVLTYFGVLVKDTKCYVQIAVGAFTLNDMGSALASINSTLSTHNVIVRYFYGTRWMPWLPLQPQRQTSCSGDSGYYVFSEGTQDNTRTILSSKMWTYTHTDRNLFLRFKHWGAANNTDTTDYNQVLLCHVVNRNRDGLMDKYVFARILNNTLAEGLSTTDSVIVNYTNFDASGNKQLELTKATSAKAGVMTAAQATQLSALDSGLQQITLGGKMVFRTLAGDKVIETHSDYVGEEVSLSDFDNSTLTNYAEGEPIELFKTKGAYGVPAQKYMIWFGRRVRDSSSSNNGALLRYDFKTIAGMEPLALYNSVQIGNVLHFWTLSRGHAAAYKGSPGLVPQLEVVPYVMNTDDKAVIDRLKASLSKS
ncbi:hypothetical protein [Prevotellamassilia timonensis]|uniref:hypothetical protein n=1 Tax=Prevotellamassilia timonensis TaxID=1852370 RepID=UPI0023F3DC10|nr:hypothetical protein [Prevotellamassilia timonensis]MDD7440797.1 hypothetical protein [Prevotellamassilia timonensis]